jgi:riboflavin kinase/FMN adenylyltransferase
MEVTWLPNAEPRPRHVAVGEFDGVHLGHREVMCGADTVLTFEPHPRTVVAPEMAPKLLTSLETKTDLIAALGARELIVVPFDGDFASRSPQDFIDRVLVDQLAAECVSVGENFRFGHRAKGDAALLRAQDSFETRVVDLVEVDGEVVSSTRIRELVEAGEMERATAFLGSPFQLRGAVAHGDKRGRTLGFPTANLEPDPALVYPAHGVYACRAALALDDGWSWWPAATNVGVRPTFVTGRGLLVEAYLLGFDGELYGHEMRLEFLRRLRGELRFESVEELVEQMQRDVEDTRRIATLPVADDDHS